jgi:hypothetical protein
MRNPICAVAGAVAVLIPLFIAHASSAAELTPYSLPSQQFQYTSLPPTAKPLARSDALESFYRRFAEESLSLKRDSRGKLAANFSSSRETALRAGKVQEAEHFSKLVKILEAGK